MKKLFFLASASRCSCSTRMVQRWTSTYRDIDTAFASLGPKGIDALVVNPDPLFLTRRVQLATLTARHRVSAIYSTREHAEAGGLMSYGASDVDRHRQVGIYVGRILNGEKPADLPVVLATSLFKTRVRSPSPPGLVCVYRKVRLERMVMPPHRVKSGNSSLGLHW